MPFFLFLTFKIKGDLKMLFFDSNRQFNFDEDITVILKS